MKSSQNRKYFTAGPSCLLRLTRFFFLLSLWFTHRAGSNLDISISIRKFLVLMLMIMLKCEPAHNRYNALVTYLVLQTFLSVFRYLSAVRFLSRSSDSFLVREDKDNGGGKTKDYAMSFFDPQSPSLRFSPLPSDSVTHVGMQWECYRAEKRKCLMLRPTVENENCSYPC